MELTTNQKINFWQLVPFAHLLKVFVPALFVFALSLFFAFSQQKAHTNDFFARNGLELSFVRGTSIEMKVLEKEQYKAINTIDSLSSSAYLATNADTVANLFFDNYGLLSLNENTEIKVNSIDYLNKIISIELLKGDLFVDNSYLDFQVFVETANTIYETNNGAFIVGLKGAVEDALSINHSIYVESKKNPTFYSALSYLESIQFVDESYTTNFISIDDQSENKWMKDSIQNHSDLKVKYNNKANDALAVFDLTVKDKINDKFLDIKKIFDVISISEKTYITQKMAYFFSLFLLDRNVDQFKASIDTLKSIDADLTAKLLTNYVLLFYDTLPNTSNYQLKNVFLDESLSLKMNPSDLMPKLKRERLRLFEVFELLQKGDIRQGKDSFQIYQNKIKIILANTDSIDKDALKELVFHKDALDDLYIKYFSFYDLSFWEAYFTLKSKILTIAESDPNYSLYAIDFVEQYIKILTSIVTLIKDNVIEADKTLETAKRLNLEASLTLNDLNDYITDEQMLNYKTSIEEFENILRFLESSEYKFADTDFDMAYQNYLSKQSDLSELERYLNSLDGNVNQGAKRVNPATIIESVYKAFRNEGLEIQGLKSLDDKDFRLFSFDTSVYSGIPYSGKYDNETALAYDLIIDEKAMSTSVVLSDLADFLIAIRFQDYSSDTQEQEVDNTIETEHNAAANPKVKTK